MRWETTMRYTLLLTIGLGILIRGAYGQGTESILKDALLHNDLSAISNHIANGSSIDLVEGNDGQTLLHIAAAANQLKIAQFLIDRQANVNARDNRGMTPLHWAAYNGYQKMIALLFENKAEIDAGNVNGLTPLHMAVSYGHKDTIELLLKSGANVNSRTYDMGMTPILWAAFCGYTDGIKPLLKYRADVNSQDCNGNTPLEWAEEYNHYDMARLIARKGGKRQNK
jgi:ankyrin repeat protein